MVSSVLTRDRFGSGHETGKIIGRRENRESDDTDHRVGFGPLREDIPECGIQVVVIRMVGMKKWVRSLIIIRQRHRGGELCLLAQASAQIPGCVGGRPWKMRGTDSPGGLEKGGMQCGFASGNNRIRGSVQPGVNTLEQGGIADFRVMNNQSKWK